MMPRTIVWLAMLAALTAAAQPGSPPKGAEPVGMITQVKGKGYWREKRGAPEKPITDPRMALVPGQVLRCEPGGLLEIALPSGTKRLACSAELFTVTWQPTGQQTPEARKFAELMRIYSRPGASERGGEGGWLLGPADNSVVDPGKFTIRWTPAAGTVALKLTGSGRTIWHETLEDGGNGVFESPTARQALAAYSAAANPGPLTLAVSADGASGQVTFEVLTDDGRAKVESELKYWDRQESVFLRHVGRASVFINQRMYGEAAEEYEAALADSPDSSDLRAATIRAEKSAGNRARARELSAR
jgi:hypothetical protein